MDSVIVGLAKSTIVVGAIIGGCGVMSIALGLTHKRDSQEDTLGASVFLIGIATFMIGLTFVWLGRTTLQILTGG